jgi:hypothetical protein
MRGREVDIQYYSRSNSGVEADFVLEDMSERRLVFGETKRRLTIRPSDFRNISNLVASARDSGYGEWRLDAVVVNPGGTTVSPSAGLTVVGAGSPGGIKIP